MRVLKTKIIVAWFFFFYIYSYILRNVCVSLVSCMGLRKYLCSRLNYKTGIITFSYGDVSSQSDCYSRKVTGVEKNWKARVANAMKCTVYMKPATLSILVEI